MLEMLSETLARIGEVNRKMDATFAEPRQAGDWHYLPILNFCDIMEGYYGQAIGPTPWNYRPELVGHVFIVCLRGLVRLTCGETSFTISPGEFFHTQHRDCLEIVGEEGSEAMIVNVASSSRE